MPGGGGNWGGSWLAVPTQSKYPKEAAKLAEYLTNAKSQVEAFKLKGPLPTNLKALKNAGVPSYTNEYFSNAPTGKIFGESVAKIKPIYLGPEAPGGQGERARAGPAGVRERASRQGEGLGAVHEGRQDSGCLLSDIPCRWRSGLPGRHRPVPSA